MDRKVILVTGANKGIGYEVVRQLARMGHTVILASRDSTRGRLALSTLQVEGLGVAHVQLDVTDNDSIKAAAVWTREKFARLDVLINNAAVLLREDESLSGGTAEAFHKTMRTNVFGPVQVVRQFLPLIPSGGRIIMTSSGGGSMTDPVGGWAPVYCISKSALNAVTRHLAYELSGRSITVNAYCPGWVRTDMGGRSAPRSLERGAATAVWLASTPEELPTGQFFRDRKLIPW